MLILITLVTFLISVIGLSLSAFAGHVVFDSISAIDASSMALFLVTCSFAIQSERNYFLMLPFILLAFPTSVNNFFPGVFLGLEYPPTVFPFLTHIDVFLIVGIFKAVYVNKRLHIRCTSLMIIVLTTFLLSSFVNLFKSNTHLIALIIAGLFPLRFLILLILLVSNTEVLRHERHIVYGLVISVFFLFAESLIYSHLHPNPEGVLASGSLAANTFANIIASILLFFIMLRSEKYRISGFIFYPLIFCCGLVMLLTETRMSILAALVSFFFLQLFRHNIIRSVLVALFFAILFVVIYKNIDVPNRYSLEYLSSKIEFMGWAKDPMDIIRIERTAETNSLHSRLKLFSTSVNMATENPVFGTGHGTFNYLKNNYGFDEVLLIDAHNGYLNTLAQMGVCGVPLIYFIYLFPFLTYRRLKNRRSSFLIFLFVISTTMAIADMSNAGIYKYPIFALLAFNAVILSKLRDHNPADN